MIVFGIFIFVVCLVAFYRKKSTRAQNDAENRFWDRERQANATRRKDISDLPYITIPFENFPIGICKEEKAATAERTLQELSTKKILNLGRQTNTDLKLKYGPSNLDALSECDQNFAILCRTLVEYAGALLDNGYEKEAKTVLEFGISCGSDVSTNYTLLADIYRNEHDTAKISDLLDQAKELDSIMRNAIVKKLEDRLAP